MIVANKNIFMYKNAVYTLVNGVITRQRWNRET